MFAVIALLLGTGGAALYWYLPPNLLGQPPEIASVLPPTETPTPASTVLSTSTPVAIPLTPNLRHIDEKHYMLELINAERTKAGLNPIVLGDNIAAQLHAESALANCSSSHWGIDGLKPYVRYALAGGYQSTGENVAGLSYCIRESGGFRPIASIEQGLREAMGGLMGSQGHRRQISGKWHQKVNIGLAWDRYNLVVVQQFEGDYIEYILPPTIANGILTMSGKLKGGVHLFSNNDLSVQVYYDPPPRTLTRGQLSRTYCYDLGLHIASLRPSLWPGWYYDDYQFTAMTKPCLNPYDLSADTSAPSSYNEAHTSWRRAYLAYEAQKEEPVVVPWITASGWSISGNTFSVTANLSHLLASYAEGVYTLAVWGKVGYEDVAISDYPIFHGITRPDTYSPGE